MDGNARFEGFAIDLFKHISEFLQFNVTYKLKIIIINFDYMNYKYYEFLIIGNL